MGLSQKQIPSDETLRTKVAIALGIDEARFSNQESPRGVPSSRVLEAINSVLSDYGFTASNPTIIGLDGLRNAITSSLNGVVLTAVTEGVSLTPNHLMVVRWAGNSGENTYFVNPGDITEEKLAYISPMANALDVDVIKWVSDFIGHTTNSEGQWVSRNVYVISKNP